MDIFIKLTHPFRIIVPKLSVDPSKYGISYNDGVPAGIEIDVFGFKYFLQPAYQVHDRQSAQGIRKLQRKI